MTVVTQKRYRSSPSTSKTVKRPPFFQRRCCGISAGGRTGGSYSQWEGFPYQDHQNFWEIKTDPRTGLATDSPQRLSNWAGLELLSPFNLSATGKRLAFIKSHFGSDVYVSELKKSEIGLLLPRRVTLDERWDRHASWTGDSKAIYFSSNRRGNFDIYRQGINELTAKEAVTGPEDEEKPQLSPDGSWLLYLSYPYPRMPVGTPPRPCRLMRMPVDGGPTQIVFNPKTKSRA